MQFKFSFIYFLAILLVAALVGGNGNNKDNNIQASPTNEAQELKDLPENFNSFDDRSHADGGKIKGNHVLSAHGRPVQSLTAPLTIGKRGDILLKDVNLLNQLAHFDRERIPERAAHAKGAGAHGYFEVTHDISNLTRASLFARVGKITPVFVRFSTVGGDAGSADTLRDTHGFAVKFYTDQGNWDLVGNNLLVFPIRDPILFPSLIHSRKRHPQTHLRSLNTFWDFASLRPETTHHALQVYSDLGLPDGHRFMNGGGVHAFKFVNKAQEAVYVKFHWISQQGLKNLTRDQAQMLAGSNPDYSTQDLFEAIQRKEFPSWDLKVQIMTFEEAEKYRWNPFDVTKEWFVQDFPLRPVGRMTLNRNPKDYFTEVEMAAFDPGNLVPGIELSPDRMLQGRSFSYLDTQRYRLGANFPQLAINRPRISQNLYTYERDGIGMSGPKSNGDGGPNYFPNSFGGPSVDPEAADSVYKTEKVDIQRLDMGDDDNFSQPKIFLEKMCKRERERLVDNLAHDLKGVDEPIRGRALENFKEVDKTFSMEVKMAIDQMLA